MRFVFLQERNQTGESQHHGVVDWRKQLNQIGSERLQRKFERHVVPCAVFKVLECTLAGREGVCMSQQLRMGLLLSGLKGNAGLSESAFPLGGPSVATAFRIAVQSSRMSKSGSMYTI